MTKHERPITVSETLKENSPTNSGCRHNNHTDHIVNSHMAKQDHQFESSKSRNHNDTRSRSLLGHKPREQNRRNQMGHHLARGITKGHTIHKKHKQHRNNPHPQHHKLEPRQPLRIHEPNMELQRNNNTPTGNHPSNINPLSFVLILIHHVPHHQRSKTVQLRHNHQHTRIPLRLLNVKSM